MKTDNQNHTDYMEKEIVLATVPRAIKSLSSFATSVMNVVKLPFVLLRNYYSSIFGYAISTRQTWLLVLAQLLFVASVFVGGMPILLRFLFLGLSALAIRLCRF